MIRRRGGSGHPAFVIHPLPVCPVPTPGAAQPDKADDGNPAQKGPQRRVGHELLDDIAQPVIGFGEQEPCEPENQACDRDFQQQHRIDVDLRQSGEIVDMIGSMMDAPGMAGPVAQDRRAEAGNEGGILDAPDRQDFEREHRSRDRRAEHRAKTGGDTRHQHDPHIPLVEGEQPPERAREAPAELHGGAFAPGGTAEQMRDHRC